MNDIEKKPIDPFADINFDTFTNPESNINTPTTESSLKKEPLDKEALKKVAEASHFNSRQPAQNKKPKLVTKTFSLFQDEITIINNSLKAYMEHSGDDLSSPSNSDAVRAGLHLLSNLDAKQQAELIAKHRGRGRR